MKSLPRSKRTQQAREQSIRQGKATLIIKNSLRREFFRYIEGELAEYDCRRYRRNEVELTPLEEQVADSPVPENLP